MMYVLCGQFAGDRGKKRGFKRSRRREKERERGFTLREKEVEEKRKHDEEVLKQQQEVVKARAVIAGPVQVGKIDLNLKKAAAACSVIQLRSSAYRCRKSGSTESKTSTEKPVVKKKVQEKLLIRKR
jgi:translation initiation factor IF-2